MTWRILGADYVKWKNSNCDRRIQGNRKGNCLGAGRERSRCDCDGAKEAAEAVVKEIKDKGGAAESYGCDVSGYSACEEFIRRVAEKYGAVDILVNNAGITRDNLLMKMTEEDFSAVIDTNLKGTFYTMRFVKAEKRPDY